MDKHKLLALIETAWQEFRNSWQDLSETEFATTVSGTSTLKDIIAHVTTWEQEALEHLPVVLSGKRPRRYSDQYGGLDAFNELKRTQKQSLSVAEVISQSNEIHEQLVQFLAGQADELFQSNSRFIRRIRNDTYDHYRKHTERINSWRKKDGLNDTRGFQTEPRWLVWAKEMQSIAQNGLFYANSEYDRERYAQLMEITAEMVAHQSGTQDLRPVRDLLKHDTGYVTPKVDVRGAVFQENRILLVRETADEGRWTLPGGWADPNDFPSVAVEREIREETGYTARAKKLLAVYDRSHARHRHQPPFLFHIYKLFFLCELTGGEPRQSHETGECAFFAESELPKDLSISRISTEQLLRCFRALREPELPADFD